MGAGGLMVLVLTVRVLPVLVLTVRVLLVLTVLVLTVRVLGCWWCWCSQCGSSDAASGSHLEHQHPEHGAPQHRTCSPLRPRRPFSTRLLARTPQFVRRQSPTMLSAIAAMRRRTPRLWCSQCGSLMLLVLAP